MFGYGQTYFDQNRKVYRTFISQLKYFEINNNRKLNQLNITEYPRVKLIMFDTSSD